MTDVLVAGAGIVGLTVALKAADAGLDVVLADDLESGFARASSAAGAMLCPFSELTGDEPAETLDLEIEDRLASRRLYPEFLDRLNLTHASVEFRTGLVLAASASHAHSDLANVDRISAIAMRFGSGADLLGPKDLKDLLGNLNCRPIKAVFLPDEASLDVRALLAGLIQQIKIHPRIRFIQRKVTGYETTGDELTVGLDEVTPVVASNVVLCAGVAIPSILQHNLAPDVLIPNVFGGRGVALQVASDFGLKVAVRVPNRGFACGTHAVPNTEGRLYVGATNHLVTDSRQHNHPEVGELATLFASIQNDLGSVLSSAKIYQIVVGYRPVTIDRTPLVGRTADPRVLVATGTWRNGVLFAPLIAQLIVNELKQRGSIAEHRFSPRRILKAPDGVNDDWWEAAASDLLGTSLDASARATLQTDWSSLIGRVLSLTLADTSTEPKVTMAARRLWNRAPMREVLPTIVRLLGRR